MFTNFTYFVYENFGNNKMTAYSVDTVQHFR